MTPQEKLILIAVLAALMLFIVFFELRVMRGKSKEIRKASQRKDEAFNAILTTRHVVNIVQRQGRDTRTAQSILEEAKYALQKGDYDNAMNLAEKARTELTHPSRAAQGAANGPAQDLEKVAEEVLSTPKDDNSLYTGTKLPVDQTGSYMSAQFELNGAREDIAKALTMGKHVSSAQVLMAEADAAFAQGNYTKVLSMAVRARKAIGVGGAVETIPLKSPERDEIAEEPMPSSGITSKGSEECNKCGAPVERGDAFCGKCGARVPRERSCESCGTKAKPNDKFCRKCGGKIA